MTNSSPNALDERLDIAGSKSINASKTLSDEPLGLGQALSGGSGASLTTLSGSSVTIGGLSGMSAASVGNFITISGSTIGANNGTFIIESFISATSIIFTNPSASLPDASSIPWIQRQPYRLEDDVNFARTDRGAIKGANYYDPIPVYQRPTNTAADVSANLTNIAGKTTDSRGLIVNIIIHNETVVIGDGFITITSTGNLQHSTSLNKVGIPCFDTSPYLGNFKAAYVEITNGSDDSSLTVLSGVHIGEKIFGITRSGSSTSPDSVEVVFYSSPRGQDIETSSSLYTWESGQSTAISCVYGFFKRLDQLSDEDLRQGLSSGGSSSGTAPTNGYNLLNQFLFSGM